MESNKALTAPIKKIQSEIRIWKKIIRNSDCFHPWNDTITLWPNQEVLFIERKTIFPELGSAECISCKKKKKRKIGLYFPPLMVRTYERRYMDQIELLSWNLTKLGTLISCPIKCVISLIQGNFWKIKCIQCNVLLRGS